ncbi:putative O-glycosylation ligase, exosortase A system-associated [Hydrogenophaga sp.]|uniref:putative O-glycosylation ligase, exosortase A system-associated n=1 Tax=Hydrogenophaga sp. TaxID=1904254 RepID=UPI0026267C9D|nr:putative O-glycosylation ligase, exosortase A system-associated [Hydrogenophaga sp.]MCW5652272.1 putative O-glycosylation ligase, exosortase A system-associated [Hydrogenophaga sp.]
MRGILLLSVYMAFLYMGFHTPFILVMGYVWADIFTPQRIAYSIMPSIPVSMILGLCVFLSLFRLPKDPDIRLRAATLVTAMFGVWMTITLLWAAVPAAAMYKWDWAVKAVLFSCLIPFFLRSRMHIEAMLWTIVVAGIAHCIPFGVKVLVSGGGYGKPLGLIMYNAGLGEGSTLAMFAVFLIPMCLYLYKWQTLLPEGKWVKPMLIFFIIMALLTAVGTYARTGLVCIGVLGMLLILRSRHKVAYLVIVGVAGFLLSLITSDEWAGRMGTIGDDTEGSAMARVAVWFWTLEYVATHPLGGSFDVYRISQTALRLSDGSVIMETGRAFHSIYFEILGETGIPGMAMYLTIVLLTRNAFARIARRKSAPEDAWINDAARYLLFSLYILMAGGAFVAVGFQPYFYYLAALSVGLININGKLQKAA